MTTHVLGDIVELMLTGKLHRHYADEENGHKAIDCSQRLDRQEQVMFNEP